MAPPTNINQQRRVHPRENEKVLAVVKTGTRKTCKSPDYNKKIRILTWNVRGFDTEKDELRD